MKTKYLKSTIITIPFLTLLILVSTLTGKPAATPSETVDIIKNYGDTVQVEILEKQHDKLELTIGGMDYTVEDSKQEEIPDPKEESEQQLFVDTDVITKFINVESANIRDTWSTEGNIVATYHLNDEILVLGEGIPGTPAEGWSRITVLESPNYVYISTSLLSEEPIEVQAQPPVKVETPVQKVEVPVKEEVPTQGGASITQEEPSRQPQQPQEPDIQNPSKPKKGTKPEDRIVITEDSKQESNPDLTGITFK